MVGYLNPDRAGVNNQKDGLSNVITKATILAAKEVITETYIILGCFDRQNEAENYSKYVKTKFARFLVFLTLTSMHITQVNYQFVPDQDFSSNSDIDWSKTVDEIDEQLYKKYGIDNDEISYINNLIKPME